jgi:hypothetical protein
MNYQKKYLKYKGKYLSLKDISTQSNGIKSKYLTLKHKINGGRIDPTNVIGINYEGGKIIRHILRFAYCLGYVNCQIAMDAPYHTPPRVADESIRSVGRSESQFKGYDEIKLKEKLLNIFKHIKEKFGDKKLVIQIARGRAAKPTYEEVIKPVIDQIKFSKVIFQKGYRYVDYYIPTDCEPFIFFNYGMFAELSEDIKIDVGEICNPIETWDVTREKDNNLLSSNNTSFIDARNILNAPELNTISKKMTLFGIDDAMPFITPKDYSKESILGLLELTNVYL